MRFGILQLLICLVLVAACSPGGAPRNEVDRAAIEASADSATWAFLDAQRARDPERAIAHLAPGFYMYNDGVRLAYDSVAASIRATMGTFQHFDSEWTRLDARALGPDAALVTFVFRDSIVLTTGDTLSLRGSTTLVWERRGADWRITYADADHYPVTSQ